MFCKECGAKIDNDSKFCMYCGAKLFLTTASERQTSSVTNTEKSMGNFNASDSKNQSNNKTSKEKIIEDKYDRSYKGDAVASWTGFIVLLVNSTFYALSKISYDETLSVVSAVILVIWWVISIFWIVEIAKRQNRSSLRWGIFAFCFPYAAIIIIGLLKKLKNPINKSYSSGPKQDTKILTEEEEARMQNPEAKSEEGPIESPKSVSTEEIVVNPQLEEIKNVRHFEVGSKGLVSNISGNPAETVEGSVSYKIVQIYNIYKSPKEARIEFSVDYSDLKRGTLIYSSYRRRYFFDKNKNHEYFADKENAISALHYYLCNNVIKSEDSFKQHQDET